MYHRYKSVNNIYLYTFKKKKVNACAPATTLKENIVSNLETQYMSLFGHILLPTVSSLTSLK